MTKKLETKVYSQEGKESEKFTLPSAVFDVPWNADTVHQVVTAMQSNAREPWAHTKDRSERSGTGRKPWRQKGTGRARHGSRRSPIWRKGGVAFGPRNERSYKQKINQKMRTKALYMALSRKHRDGELVFVDALSFTEPKTRAAKEILTTLSGIKGYKGITEKKKNAALVVLAKNDANAKRSFKNIGSVAVALAQNLNPLDVLTYKYVIISNPKESVSILASRITKN